MKQKHFIDIHKGITPFFIAGLIYYFQQWYNATALIYLSLHGSYGILWVLKSKLFGDKSWDRPCNLGYGLLIWATLSIYWLAPWLITSQKIQAPPWLLAAGIGLYSFGLFFHFVADMQKHMWLKMSPGRLLTEGLWSKTRNPNYFGELLIYLGFTMLAMQLVPLVALLAFVLLYWVPNMLRKDRSLSRYREFAEYRRSSKLFIPFVV